MISAGGGAGDRYIAVNNSYGPFKNVNLRKAVWAATDREALNKACAAARLVADVMTHFLWNGIPGFERSRRLRRAEGRLQRTPDRATWRSPKST